MKGSKYRSKWFYLAVWVLLAGFTFTIGGCGADTKSLVSTATGGLVDTGGGTTTTVAKKVTTVAGKIKLSSTISGGASGLKARAKAVNPPMMADLKGRPMGKTMKGSPASPGNRLSKAINRAVSHASETVTGADITLFDADHPEWLYPVAEVTSDADGNYKLDVLANAEKNLNSDGNKAYTDGDSIPAGIYTLIVIFKESSGTVATSDKYPFPRNVKAGDKYSYRYLVGIQAIVKKFEGAVTDNNITLQASDATPQVVSIMGKKISSLKKTDSGAYDVGSFALNAAIQVIFDMAIYRDTAITYENSMTVEDPSGNVVPGKWKISPDLTIATFYPTNDLTENTTYTIKLIGELISNYYGKALKSDVSAFYKTGAKDTTPPNAIRTSPKEKENVSVTATIKFAADELMDVNTITVSSTPSIGDKPRIIYLGSKLTELGYDYSYQIDTAGNPLDLNTDYAFTISGGKDLGGNAMTSVTFNFKTEATSAGVTGTGTIATAQTEVKSLVGKWVEAVNSGDVVTFGLMLSGDFTYKIPKQNKCDKGQPCSFDADKNGELSYEEFFNFIEDWFNKNDKIPGWTGSRNGVHVTGDVAKNSKGEFDIKIDESKGIAAFAFQIEYEDENGDAIADYPAITLYITVAKVNGEWFITSLSDKDTTGKGASVANVATVSPTGEQAQGTKSITFKWTPVTSVTVKSYAVVLLDANDPLDNTGWVGIIDASKITGDTATFDYSSTADFDSSDGKLILPGGKKDAPFNKELKLQDGGKYEWFVIGFGTLTASEFATGKVDPDADIVAKTSSNVSISVAGTLTSKLKVQILDTASKTALLYSTGPTTTNPDAPTDAWDATVNGKYSPNTVKLKITGTTKEGKIYVYGNYQNEKAFQFTGGSAEVDVDIYNGYNWIDVTDGVNWWYATTTETGAATASNNVYTSGGVTYSDLTVDSVTAVGVSQKQDTKGYYNIKGNSITLKGNASPDITLYVYNSNDNCGYHTVSVVTNATSGSYEATIDIYSGYNWVSLYDGFGNWAYVNINNSGEGASCADATEYISNVKVEGKDADITGGSTYTVTATDVTISGKLASTGNGYWYAWGITNYEAGTLWNNNGSFSFDIRVDSGTNTLYLYDVNWNYKSITIDNKAEAATVASSQPNTITKIDYDGVGAGLTHEPTQEDYYYHTAKTCTVTIEGKSPVSGSEGINLYYSYYGKATIYDSLSTEADDSGVYSFTVDIGSGTYANVVEIYDSSWNWQGIKITGPDTCGTPSTVALTIGVYKTSGEELSLGSSGYFDAGTDNSVTIKGAAKSGKTVSISLSNYDSSYYDYYSTTASGDKYSINVSISRGSNLISINDGSTWKDLTVYSSSSTTVSVVTLTADAYKVGETTKLSLTSGWYYDVGSSNTVTIKGSAKSGRTVEIKLSNSDADPDYYDYISATATSDNKYSINLSVVKGYNYLSINDGYTMLYLTVYSSTTTTTVTSVTLTADVYKTGEITKLSLTSAGYYDVGSAGSIEIRGDAKSGRNIDISVSNSGVYNSLSATASSDNKYKISIDITNGENSIKVSDSSSSLNLKVKTTYVAGQTYKYPKNVKVDNVSSSSDYDSIYYGSGSWNVTTSSVTVTGNAMNGTGYYYHYNSSWSVVASGSLYISSNSFSQSLNLSSGYNYVYVYDSSWNYYYMTINTSGGTVTYNHPKNVKVDNVSGSSEVDSTYYGSGSWNVTASSVTVTGNAKTGTGYYYHYDKDWYTQASGSLTITENSFSLPTLNLKNGYNYVYVYDSSWNYYYMTIYTSGGTVAAKIVGVTSPKQNDLVSGTITVSGKIDTTQFTPAYIYGYVYNYSTYTSTYYYWDKYGTTYSGYSALTYSSGNVSFSASVSSGTTMIEIYAYDSNWYSHGHYIYVNNSYSYSEYSWKPGMSNGEVGAAAQTEFLKWMTNDIKKHQQQ